MTRIQRIGVFQTAKIAAIIYFVIIAIIAIPMALIMSAVGYTADIPGLSIGIGLIYIVAPFFYAIIIFIMTALGCALYNLVASWIGGIPVELEKEYEVS